MSGLTIISPADPVLSAEQARAQARIDHTSEDDLLTAYVAAAMAEAEEITGRALWRTGYQLTLGRFPPGREPILCPRPRLVTVDAITYRDADGAEQALDPDGLQLDGSGEPGRLVPAVGTGWPSTQAGAAVAVTIEFTAGPEDPDPLGVQAVRLAVADWFEHREAVTEGAVSRLPNGFERLLHVRRFRHRGLSRFLADY